MDTVEEILTAIEPFKFVVTKRKLLKLDTASGNHRNGSPELSNHRLAVGRQAISLSYELSVLIQS